MENSDSIIFNPIHICHDADLAMIIAPGPDRREIITLTDMEESRSADHHDSDGSDSA